MSSKAVMHFGLALKHIEAGEREASKPLRENRIFTDNLSVSKFYLEVVEQIAKGVKPRKTIYSQESRP